MGIVLHRFNVNHENMFYNPEHKARIDHIIPVSKSEELIVVTLNQLKSACHLICVGSYVCKRPNLMKKNF